MMRFLVLVAVGLIHAALGQQLNQKATLYELSNSGGESIFLPETYSGNLSQLGFDDRTHSVCVTGMWMFYENVNFNSDGTGGAEYVFGKDNYCVNMLTVPGVISSVRYAGSPASYGEDSFTLYEYDFFQGAEEFTYVDRPNINLAGKHKSVIITGNSDWTIFDEPEYQGNPRCLRFPPDCDSSEENTPLIISNLEELDPAVPAGSIRSVQKGCVCQPLRSAFMGVGGVHVTKQ